MAVVVSLPICRTGFAARSIARGRFVFPECFVDDEATTFCQEFVMPGLRAGHPRLGLKIEQERRGWPGRSPAMTKSESLQASRSFPDWASLHPGNAAFFISPRRGEVNPV